MPSTRNVPPMRPLEEILRTGEGFADNPSYPDRFRDTIPEDVMTAAIAVSARATKGWTGSGPDSVTSLVGEVASAILTERLAERERCAKQIEVGFTKAIGKKYDPNKVGPSKLDECPHGRRHYEDCEQCCADAIRNPS